LADAPPERSSAVDAGAGTSPAPAPGTAVDLPPINPEPSVWRGLTSFRGTTPRIVDLYVGVIGVVVFLLLWDLAAEPHRIVGLLTWIGVLPAGMEVADPKLFVAAPQDVVVRLYELFVYYEFLDDIGISIYRIWVAFIAAVIMAIPIGIWMSSYRLVNGLLEPIVDFIRYLPVPALVPLTVVWFGIGDTMKIALLWLGTFFQIVLLIADDARRVPREYIEIGMTVGAKPGQILRHIILRAMAPSMVDNLRIGLGWCWTYVVIAEIVASNSGVGYVIMSARRYQKTPEIYAGIITIGIIGLLTDQAIRWAHRRYFAYLR